MAGRTLFSFRVLRCPACSATLPVHGSDSVIECEYCDARVELARPKSAPTPASPAPTPTGPAPTPRVYTAQPRLSGFTWFLLTLALSVGVGGIVFVAVADRMERFGLWELFKGDEAAGEPPASKSTKAPAKRSKRKAKPRPSKATKDPKATKAVELGDVDAPAPEPEELPLEENEPEEQAEGEAPKQVFVVQPGRPARGR